MDGIDKDFMWIFDNIWWIHNQQHDIGVVWEIYAFGATQYGQGMINHCGMPAICNVAI